MPKTLLVVSGSCLLIMLAACSTAPPAPGVDLAAEEAKIREAETTVMKNWAAKDTDKILAYYADDATLMVQGTPQLKGKDAMRPALKTMLDDPNFKLDFAAQRVEISKSGDVAFSQGTYTLVVTDPKTKKPFTDKGSYVTGYRKQSDGTWKAVSDINVSQLPAPGAGQ
jgi:uncharacterized protein (TIGR02246 family)